MPNDLMTNGSSYTTGLLYYLETKNIIILSLFFFLIYWFLIRNADNTSHHTVTISRRPNRRRFSPFSLKHYKIGSQAENTDKNSPNQNGFNKRKRNVRKRDQFIGVMKRILSVSDVQPASIPSGPPQEYFDPLEDMNIDALPTPLPREVSLLLKNLQIFGHYEKPMFMELCKSVETQFVPAGAWLFRPGNKEDSIYVVFKGKIGIHILEHQQDLVISEVEEGHPVYSLLSLSAELVGYTQIYKTVAAQAMVDSTVIKLKVEYFKGFLSKNPDTFLRILQVLALNLMRINFLALHKYLDLQAVLLQDYKAPYTNDNSPLTPKKDLVSPRKKNSSVRFSLEEQQSTDFDTFLHQARLNPTSISDLLLITEEEYYNSQEENTNEIDKEESKALEKGRQALAQIFQLQDATAINRMTQLITMPKGTIVYSEGELKDFVYYVYSGKLVCTSRNPDDIPIKLYCVHAGEFEAVLSMLTGEPSIATLTTLTDVQLILLSKPMLFSIFKEEPHVLIPMASSIINRLSPFMRQIDFALNWVPLDAGVVLYKQDDSSDSAYIVLSGRLRSFIANEKGNKELIEEFGRGDIVGMVEVMTKSPYATTVYAIRDTHLVSLPTGLLNWIKVKAPQVVYRLIQLLGEKVLGSYKKVPVANKLPSSDLQYFLGNKNVSTVAIIAANSNVPISRFSEWLLLATNKFGSSRLLSSYSVQKSFSQNLFKIAHDYHFITWLERQEEDSELLLYQADARLTSWTKRCLRQADCILIVDTAENGPTIGPIVKQLNTTQNLVQRALVLLHRESTVIPKGTASWLKEVGYCSGRFHIRCPDYLFQEIDQNPESETDDDENMFKRISPRSDICRLARWLTGSSVGLVLGGGGARGGAHVGVIKALMESDIPIDIVGGTSMGACIGAMLCQARDYRQVEEMSSDLFKSLSKHWRQITDVTIPFTSVLTGSHFNNIIRTALGDHMIEDLWIPFFCITTDISENRMRVHQNGPLWPYVRASMTLTGYFPPICEPHEGNLLVDGGYLNNLPADVIKILGAKTVIAVDVSSEVVNNFTNYGYSLSGWWILWKKWVPFTGKINIPSMGDIQRGLTFVASVQQLDEVKASDCEYIRPSLGRFGLLQFSSHNELVDIGHDKMKSIAESWKKNPKMMRKMFSISTHQSERPQHGTKFYSIPFPKQKDEGFSRLRSLSNLASLTSVTNILANPTPTCDIMGYWSSPDVAVDIESGCFHKCASDPVLISDSENNTESSIHSRATSTEDVNQTS
ncbi:Neuropathy target esterase [Oopsacas minuta]|uniref:lysophospholipase n=1 Tax=Oopsacas minuta TaxID=111878 RepID=A0AAV7JZU8_9METZ|nr:Neuropathy target esterase [Oopsacas minuta]